MINEQVHFQDYKRKESEAHITTVKLLVSAHIMKIHSTLERISFWISFYT